MSAVLKPSPKLARACGDEYHAALARQVLSRYALPKPAERVTVAALAKWCAPLDLTKQQLEAAIGMTAARFAELNATRPMLPVLGELIELSEGMR